MKDKKYVLRKDIIRLEGSDMFCSPEDYDRLDSAFKKVLSGEMTQMEYLKFRDSIPGTTTPNK
jgi:hypothetical protein